MNGTKIRDFTQGNISKQLMTFAAPIFLSNLLQVVYNMVDMMVVGNTLGKSGLSAVSVGGDLSNLLTFIAMGFSSAGQVIIAQYIGRKEKEKTGRFIGTMSGFLLLCAVVLSIMGLFFQDKLLTMMNTPFEAYEGARAYSSVCMAGMVFIYGYNIVSAILRGMGDSKRPFMFVAVAAVINLILDVIFVMYFNMGAGGAALATVISQATSFVSSVIYLIKNKENYEIDIKPSYFVKWNKPMFLSIIKLGVPMAIKTASVQVSKMFVNSWINSYGVAVSAFSGIANKIASVANLISMAMNSAGSTMVGQNIAAREYGRVVSIMKRIAIITLTIAVILSVAIAIWPHEIFSIFTDKGDTDVLALSGEYIPIAFLVFFSAALRAVMNALINGSGNYKINFVTAIFDGIVMRIGLALLLGIVLDLKHYGFWLGDALAGFTPFIIGTVFYYTGSWKREKDTKEG